MNKVNRLLSLNCKVKKGDRYGRLLVLGVPFLMAVKCGDGKRNRPYCVCQCDCGKKTVSYAGDLSHGASKSCGCLGAENLRASITKHGMTDSPIYHVWQGIKQRCYWPEFVYYANYGGRGITVCDEWRDDAAAFIDWALANGYRPGLEIDRIDNNAGYSPENCRFVTRIVNSRNKRNNRMVAAFGETKTMPEWAEDRRCAVGYYTLRTRVRLGWEPERALLEPAVRPNREYGKKAS